MKYRILWMLWYRIAMAFFNCWHSLKSCGRPYDWIGHGAKFKIFMGMVTPDGEPKRCYRCGHTKFQETVKDTINYTVCEKESTCERCNQINGYWAYGSWTWV